MHKRNPSLFLVWMLLIGAAGLSSCEKDADTTPGLVGTWQLTKRDCYCVRTPLPNETVTFTATRFSFTQNSQPVSSGTYRTASVVPCGSSTPVSVLRLSYANGMTKDFISTASANTLVLDDGLQRRCLADADVVSTYSRLPY